ncbi:ABC transporter [Streptomyces sp. AC627_RSS907]|uniref:ABC transporter n=1 Tax=Streptomyces sp. AC627_RSS907 TaxID=2823684 RepID=UPI001C2420A5|nr:ABC transporter [Streptomyces sp. AC627_RSS907]
MSTLTSIGNASSGSAPSDAGRDRALRLRGVTWLVWRQHRAAYWTLLIGGVVATAVIVYQRQGLVTYLEGYGYPGDLKEGWEHQAPTMALLRAVSVPLNYLPVLIGVFIGAPLLAADLENGTAKLVSTQSTSRVRWLTTKLGVTALIVGVSTAAVAAAFTWWWSPAKSSNFFLHWADKEVFDNSGPMLTALSLFTLFGGVAIGMLLRRMLLSMVVTMGFAVVVQVVWAYSRMSLANSVTITTRDGMQSPQPEMPDAAYEVDTSYLTSSGDLLGQSTCQSLSEKATEACAAKKSIVGWSVEYIPVSQMASMQWLGASILLALTAAVAAFIVLRGRKRVV